MGPEVPQHGRNSSFLKEDTSQDGELQEEAGH